MTSSDGIRQHDSGAVARLRALSVGTAALGSVALVTWTSGDSWASQAVKPLRAPADTPPEAAPAAEAFAAGDDIPIKEAAFPAKAVTPVVTPQRAAAPAEPVADIEYRVRRGDTLYGIAARLLGDGTRYPEIFAANRDVVEDDGARFTDADLIEPGWTLKIPVAASATAPARSPNTRPVTPAKLTIATTTVGTHAQAKPAAASGNLDSWITEARTILAAHGYKVSADAIRVTAMHESGGNPAAVNHWDSNAAAGHPSIGLMQTIGPTFDEYALPGHHDILNPVDNIIAAVRYAASRYGSLDEIVAGRCDGACWRGY